MGDGEGWGSLAMCVFSAVWNFHLSLKTLYVDPCIPLCAVSTCLSPMIFLASPDFHVPITPVELLPPPCPTPIFWEELHSILS